MVVAFALRLTAAEPDGTSDLVPPSLLPPRGEIPPGFWEQWGGWVVLGSVLLLIMVGVLIWLVSRTKPPEPVPPAIIARQDLAPLRERPEDGALLSRTSQIVRRYVAAAFTLPPEELTTTEFCRAVKENSQVGPELSMEAAEFLRACDLRKFAPSPAGPALGAVDRALAIIDHAEIRRRQLHEPSVPPLLSAREADSGANGSRVQGAPDGA